MPELSPTPQDYREARAMGIRLDDELDGPTAAAERLYNTLAVAYQRLDQECAEVHRTARGQQKELAALRWERNVLIGIGWIVLLVVAAKRIWG